uniref:1-phosphatidylinositol 4,5-bisphosphate phosphodiesterase gamma-1-like n=1 Tax=Petromyzon marinus TaxID=7757 RepID=A0AAJ7U9G8_PETMA|nr:1-phosphatidylinositol 4,5-bisphosphate phosphodiesterase gamma-1-like [Petromyzon marinus]
MSTGGGPASPAPPETLAPACRQLRQGTSMTLFQQKKSQRPERKTFQVVGETRQVVWWSRSPDKTEGIVDIREIKEIRPGKNSRDFERYQDEARKVDALLCFVVLHGTEFRLKTLSIVADSKEEASVWVTGLNWLLTDTLWAPTALQIERWLRKQFYAMDREPGKTGASASPRFSRYRPGVSGTIRADRAVSRLARGSAAGRPSVGRSRVNRQSVGRWSAACRRSVGRWPATGRPAVGQSVGRPSVRQSVNRPRACLGLAAGRAVSMPASQGVASSGLFYVSHEIAGSETP